MVWILERYFVNNSFKYALLAYGLMKGIKCMKMKKLFKKNATILKDGKFKWKGEKINLEPLIQSSAEEAVILPSINKIIPVVKDRKTDNGFIEKLTSQYKGIDYITEDDDVFKGNSKTTIAILQPISKMNRMEYGWDNEIGALLRQSTLASILKKVDVKWRNVVYTINKNQVESAVMFIPDVCVFLNSRGEFIKPIMINVLFIAMTDRVSNFKGDEVSIASALMDVFDACINLGIKDLHINPYIMKPYKKHVDTVSEVLVRIITSKKVTDNFDMVCFDFEKDEYAIKFTSAQKGKHNDDVTFEEYKDYISRKKKKELEDDDLGGGGVDLVIEIGDDDDDEDDDIDDDEYVDDEDYDEEKSESTTSKEVEKRKTLKDLADIAED